MADWESRRIEEVLASLGRMLEHQTKLLDRIVGLECVIAELLKELVASQAAPTFPAPVGIRVTIA